MVLAAILALAAQRQFGVFAEGEKEGIDGLRFAGCRKGGMAAIALPDPDRIQPAQTARADRVDLADVGAATVADQFFRTACCDLRLCLRNALCLTSPVFCLSHACPNRVEKAAG